MAWFIRHLPPPPMTDAGPEDAICLDMARAACNIWSRRHRLPTRTSPRHPASADRRRHHQRHRRRGAGTARHGLQLSPFGGRDGCRRKGITLITRGKDLSIQHISTSFAETAGLPVLRYHHHRLIRDDRPESARAKRDDARAFGLYRDGKAPALPTSVTGDVCRLRRQR